MRIRTEILVGSLLNVTLHTFFFYNKAASKHQFYVIHTPQYLQSTLMTIKTEILVGSVLNVTLHAFLFTIKLPVNISFMPYIHLSIYSPPL